MRFLRTEFSPSLALRVRPHKPLRVPGGVVGQTILRCLAPKSAHLPNSDRHPIMRVNNIILFFVLGSCNFEFF